MFENIVESWTEKESGILDTLYKSLKDGDYLNRIMILNSDLSDFTKNYLLYEFNDESTPEELRDRIEKANKLYFNYALRPKWTLQTFLFNNFESRPPNEILKKLNIFTFYNYYLDSIKDSIKDNFQIFITKTELTSIINSVDISIYEKLSKDINSIKIKNFLLQLFLIRYEKESEYNLESTIPYSFIKIFLEDKSYSDFSEKFGVVKDLDSHTELSLKDIIKILTDKYLITESPAGSEIPEEIISSDTSETEIEDNVIKKNISEEKEIREEEIDLDDKENDKIEINTIEDYDPEPEIVIRPLKEKKSAKSDLSGEAKESEKSKEIKLIEKDKNIKIAKNDKDESGEKVEPEKISIPLKNVKSDTTSKNEKEKFEKKKIYDDVNGENIKSDKNEISILFDEKKSEKILKKIYKSDQILMEMSFTKIDKCKTWDEVSSQLKQVFKKNNVNIYNKDVVYFVDKLNDYFKSK